ncbi:MAG: alpha/beta fold hydrolase [Pseudomonadota bacterium]
MDRRLAAILSADMVGFSRLMETNEDGVFVRQKRHIQELINPEVTKHRGRIVKTTGDGLLAEFPSAADAVKCAIAFQSALPKREADEPEDRQIRYRVGINVGDVIVDDGDIFGDGVNVAARLQSLSEPGGVCVSDIVHQTVLERVDVTFRDLGGQRVKNIKRTIRVWQWTADNQKEPVASDIALRQRVQFCSSEDGTQIAFADLGEGFPILRSPHWQSHIEFEWQSPIRRPLLTELARNHRLVRFDQRGNGLSDWDVERISADAMIEDMNAVVAATQLDQFALLGWSQGAAFAIRYAAENPDQVVCLILADGFMRGRAVRDDPDAERLYNLGRTMIVEGWGLPDHMYRHFFTTNFIPNAPREYAESLDEMQRVSSSPATAARIWDMNNYIDVESFAEQVRCPTLVVHAKGDKMVPISEGQKIARTIPNARFVELPGDNHLFLEYEVSFGIFLEETSAFISEHAG